VGGFFQGSWHSFLKFYAASLGEKQEPKQLAEFIDLFSRSVSNIEAYIFSQGPEFESLKE